MNMRRKQRSRRALSCAFTAASVAALLAVSTSASAEVVSLETLETLALKHRPALAREAALKTCCIRLSRSD